MPSDQNGMSISEYCPFDCSIAASMESRAAVCWADALRAGRIKAVRTNVKRRNFILLFTGHLLYSLALSIP